MRILIPARLGSKGLPGKNRILFPYTVSIIPKDLFSYTYVTTDDPIIEEMSITSGLKVHRRDPKAATDEASMKEVVTDFLKSEGPRGEVLVVLYLTYPERTWNDVERSLKELEASRLRSLLCRFETEVHPCLMAFETQGSKGRQIFKHDLYRRQDYPPCFEISHYVCAFYDDEVDMLNNNMYNDDTYFMRCQKMIDVDLKEHLERFNKCKELKS